MTVSTQIIVSRFSRKMEIEQNPFCDESDESNTFPDASVTTNPNGRVSNRSDSRTVSGSTKTRNLSKSTDAGTPRNSTRSKDRADAVDLLSHDLVEELCRESSHSASVPHLQDSNSRPASIFAQSLISVGNGADLEARDWVDGLSSVSSITSNFSTLSVNQSPSERYANVGESQEFRTPQRLRRRKKLERFMRKLDVKRQLEAQRYILLVWAERVLIRQQYRFLLLRGQGIVKYAVLVSWMQHHASRSLRAVAKRNYMHKSAAKALRAWISLWRHARHKRGLLESTGEVPA